MIGDITGGFVSDILSSLQFPLPGGVAAMGVAAISLILTKRLEEARDIFVEEMKHGRKRLADAPEDEMAAVAFRYMRAAAEGTARLNLRLLAAVASGQAETTGLYADEFLRWTDLIATLRREEIVLLAELYAFSVKNTAADADGSLWTRFLPILEKRHNILGRDADMMGAACLRTGLVQVTGGLAAITLTGLAYRPTTRLTEFMRLADIEGVLKRHDSTEGDGRRDDRSEHDRHALNHHPSENR